MNARHDCLPMHVPPPPFSARRLVAVAGLLLVGALVVLPLDLAVARWAAAEPLPGDLRRMLAWSECFGHGLGAMLILAAIAWLDPPRRVRLPRVALVALAAGLAADVVKLAVARTRPRAFDLGGEVLASFTGWLPLGAGGSDQQAFPSAHTATAVGLALALAWLYPRARWLVAMLAVLVACQRMCGSAHYLSDTLAGAACGLLAGATLLPGGFRSAWLDRLEARWAAACRDVPPAGGAVAAHDTTEDSAPSIHDSSPRSHVA